MRHRVWLSTVVAGAAAMTAGGRSSVADPVYEFVAITEYQHVHKLIRFKSDAPGTILQTTALPAISTPSEVSIVAMAARPGTREVYVLGLSSRLYRVDVDTGAIKWTSSGAGIGFRWGNGNSMDYDPASHVLRVVGALGLNMRLDPDTGAAIDGDPLTSGLQPDHDLLMADGSSAPTPLACAFAPEPGGGSTCYYLGGSTWNRVGAVGGVTSPPTAGVVTKLADFYAPGGPGPTPSVEVAPDGAAFATMQRINHAGHYLVRFDLATGGFSPKETIAGGVVGQTGTEIGIDENISAMCVASTVDGSAPPAPSPPPTGGGPSYTPPAPTWPAPAVLPARIDRATIRLDLTRGAHDSATIRGAVPITDTLMAKMPIQVGVGEVTRLLSLGRGRRAVAASAAVQFDARPRKGMLGFRIDLSHVDLAADVANQIAAGLPFAVTLKVGGDRCAAMLSLRFVRRGLTRAVVREAKPD